MKITTEKFVLERLEIEMENSQRDIFHRIYTSYKDSDVKEEFLEEYINLRYGLNMSVDRAINLSSKSILNNLV